MRNKQEIKNKIYQLKIARSKLVDAPNYESVLQSFNDQIEILEWVLNKK